MTTTYASIAVSRSGGLALTQDGEVLSTEREMKAIFHEAISICCAWEHGLILKNDGTVFEVGYNHDRISRVIGLDGIVAISCSRRNNLVLRNDGKVLAWGPNDEGQLGNGTSAVHSSSSVPVQVIRLEDVSAISAGGVHSLALKKDGTVWAWGYNGNGQLGNGSNENSNVAVQVSGLNDVTAISSGHLHSLAKQTDGVVWAFGWNKAGQLGDGTKINKNRPVIATELSGAISISAGYDHSLGLKGDGTVLACGRHHENIKELLDVKLITAADHSIFLMNDGSVKQFRCKIPEPRTLSRRGLACGGMG